MVPVMKQHQNSRAGLNESATILLGLAALAFGTAGSAQAQTLPPCGGCGGWVGTPGTTYLPGSVFVSISIEVDVGPGACAISAAGDDPVEYVCAQNGPGCGVAVTRSWSAGWLDDFIFQVTTPEGRVWTLQDPPSHSVFSAGSHTISYPIPCGTPQLVWKFSTSGGTSTSTNGGCHPCDAL